MSFSDDDLKRLKTFVSTDRRNDGAWIVAMNWGVLFDDIKVAIARLEVAEAIYDQKGCSCNQWCDACTEKERIWRREAGK